MFLASYGFYGGSVGDALNQLAQMGFFDYVLPFLLIFTLVFGILSSIKIFKENRSIDAIIALVVGLMALQFDLVPTFFAQVFPRMGVALAGILVLIILAGFFVDPKKSWIFYILMGIGTISAVAVLVSSSESINFYSSYWLYEYIPMISVLIFIGVIIAIVVGIKIKPSPGWELKPWRS